MSSTSELWIVGFVAAVGYGLSIGSFLNVVIYRLPLGQSVASPTWSYCPSCRHRLSGADLAPLISFLALGRRCRYCRQPISWRYFGVELLTGVLFALAYLRDGWGVDIFFDAVFISLLVPIFFIDLEQFFIPDELSALGFAVGVAHNLYGIYAGRAGMWSRLPLVHWSVPGAIISAVVCALVFHLISFFGLLFYGSASKTPGNRLAKSAGAFVLGIFDDYAYLMLKFLGFGLWLPAVKHFISAREQEGLEAQEQAGDGEQAAKSREEIRAEIEGDEEQTGMGQGDAKLAGMIGANLLLPLSLLSFFLAVLAGTVVGVTMMIVQKRSGRTAIPFGPFMVVGALLAFFVGHGLIAWYLGLIVPTR